MVFDGFIPLVKRCDGFDGSLWSNPPTIGSVVETYEGWVVWLVWFVPLFISIKVLVAHKFHIGGDTRRYCFPFKNGFVHKLLES